MTWGSNPTFRNVLCRYCGQECVDDTDFGPSHERECKSRPWWRKLAGWAVAYFGIMSVFLPPTPSESAWSLGLSDHPAGLAAINALLVVSSIALLFQGHATPKETPDAS